MTEKECGELYTNGELIRYIWGLAYKRARTYEDAEDMFQEAWVKIWLNIKDGSHLDYYKKIAFRAIDAARKRKTRRN